MRYKIPLRTNKAKEKLADAFLERSNRIFWWAIATLVSLGIQAGLNPEQIGTTQFTVLGIIHIIFAGILAYVGITLQNDAIELLNEVSE